MEMLKLSNWDLDAVEATSACGIVRPCHLGLDGYIVKDASVAGVDNEQQSIKEMSTKACTRIELAVIPR